MTKKTSRRNPAMDVIRCFALLCVLGIHFFKYSGYYGANMNGIQMLLLTCLRCLSTTGVALFILLTGYLMRQKQLSLKYYGKLAKTLIIYALASALCYLYRFYYHGTALGTLGELVSEIFNYEAAPYSWYIRMYIGLFLLIPFLNILYNGLESQKHKLILVLTLLTLTAFPGVTNILTYSPGNGLYLSNHSFQQILPSWWVEFYPITYYFLGAYLREYSLPLKFWPSLAAVIGTVLIAGGFNYYISRGDFFCFGPWQADASALNAVPAVLVFHTLTQLDYSKWGTRFCNFFAKLSDLCLGAYLVSWIFDDCCYALLLQSQPLTAHYLKNFPGMVLANYVFSLVLSFGISLVYQGLCKVFFFCKKRQR